jgi:hypothetical protein
LYRKLANKVGSQKPSMRPTDENNLFPIQSIICVQGCFGGVLKENAINISQLQYNPISIHEHPKHRVLHIAPAENGRNDPQNLTIHDSSHRESRIQLQ